jgi:hypothetical protein
MIWINLRTAMWVAYVKNRVSGVSLSVYIDDRTIRSWVARNVRLALHATSEYDAVVGARTHPVKTKGWTTGKTAEQKAQLRTFVLLNQIITPTESEKVLGVQHHYHGGVSKDVHAGQADRCVEAADRVRVIPRDMQTKARLVGSAAIPVLAFGAEYGPPTVEDIERCRKAIARACWGDRCAHKAVELVWTVVLNGAQCDPEQALAVMSFTKIKRLLEKHPQLMSTFQEVWEIHADRPPSTTTGPVSRMHRLIRAWGWEWASPTEMKDHHGIMHHLINTPKRTIQEAAADACREQQWARLRARKRQDFEGLASPDLQATQALLHDKASKKFRVPPEEKKLLAAIVTGGIRPLSRLYKAKVVASPLCKFCDGNVEETKEHLMWGCPCWDEVRRPHLAALTACEFVHTEGEREGSPSLWYQGVMNQDEKLHQQLASIPTEQYEDTWEPLPLTRSRQWAVDRKSETFEMDDDGTR